jgi:hypothetical protein
VDKRAYPLRAELLLASASHAHRVSASTGASHCAMEPPAWRPSGAQQLPTSPPPVAVPFAFRTRSSAVRFCFLISDPGVLSVLVGCLLAEGFSHSRQSIGQSFAGLPATCATQTPPRLAVGSDMLVAMFFADLYQEMVDKMFCNQCLCVLSLSLPFHCFKTRPLCAAPALGLIHASCWASTPRWVKKLGPAVFLNSPRRPPPRSQPRALL